MRPIEITDAEVSVPLTTSEAIARATVDALDLDGTTVTVGEVALGRMRPLSVGHKHSSEDRARDPGHTGNPGEIKANVGAPDARGHGRHQ